jgi:hypothetical protein
MNEENSNLDEQNQTEWQTPSVLQDPKDLQEPAQMSEAATLGNIFFEPGKTFEDLRRKPRFLLAGLIMILAFSAFNFLLINKIGFEKIVRSRIEASEQIQQLPADQKQKIIEQQSGPIFKTIAYAAPPIVFILTYLLGGLIYWLGTNAMGGTMTFLRGVSVWVYSSFPPTLVAMLANILVLFLKSTDDIDIAASQGGLVHANPSFFIDTKTQPVLSAIVGTFDLFFIWGWILAAIGLCVVGKISKGAAWAIVLIIALLNIAFRVVIALFS